MAFWTLAWRILVSFLVDLPRPCSLGFMGTAGDVVISLVESLVSRPGRHSVSCSTIQPVSGMAPSVIPVDASGPWLLLYLFLHCSTSELSLWMATLVWAGCAPKLLPLPPGRPPKLLRPSAWTFPWAHLQNDCPILRYLILFSDSLSVPLHLISLFLDVPGKHRKPVHSWAEHTYQRWFPCHHVYSSISSCLLNLNNNRSLMSR